MGKCQITAVMWQKIFVEMYNAHTIYSSETNYAIILMWHVISASQIVSCDKMAHFDGRLFHAQ